MSISEANIDYIGVLKYLENNQGTPYSNPDVPGVSNEKKNELLTIKQKGQAAVAEMKKMAAEARDVYGLDKCMPITWLDGSNTKTRGYLWAQIKYQSYIENPVSVSIFVEKGSGGKAYYRISLEIKNMGTDSNGMRQYHTHLEVEKKPDLVYVTGSNEWGNPEVLEESRSVIMSKVVGGAYKKVQICKLIEQKEGKTNSEFHQEVMTAIGEIIPYYDHVLGKDISSEEKRGWLLTWNSANWEWEEYEDWCTGTKKGEKYKIAWTCNSKQPKLGDDVFLMKTGEQPRGIIAHGTVTTEPYEGPHYDPEKAKAGVVSNHIDVEYDWIQNCNKGETILLQDELKEKYHQQTWNPMGSGIEIQEPILTALKEAWHKMIDNNEYWPSLAEYNPGITTDKWIELLQDSNVVSENVLTMLFEMLELGGESTCSNLAEVYGESPFSYNSWGRNLGERVYKATGCPLCVDKERERYYTIPFVGRNVMEKGHDRYSWKLRDELKEALESDMINKKGIEQIKKMRAKQKEVHYSKNMILYGPPGTGKTYNSAIYAVAICDKLKIEDVKKMDYSDVMIRYAELKKSGQIAFTTFHQSYGYEEFIEGIKTVCEEDSENIGYTIADGVFKAFCENAKIPVNLKVNPNSTIWFMRLDSDNAKTIKDECFNRDEVIIDIKEDDDWAKERFVEQMQIGDYIISYAGNSIYIDAVAVIAGEAILDETEDSYQWSRKVEWTKLEEKVDVKAINNDKYLPNFSIAKMNHMKVSDLLSLTLNGAVQEDKSPRVFIIDEINRGNISKIFGELITLIEDTKRAGMEEEMSAVLPYSGQAFSVPSNVYIIGTMNTADRSIALMDTALRRRFDFVEMMPDVNVLRSMGADFVEDLDVAAMLEKINERITFLYDREHTIGHAFFTKLARDPSIGVLKSIFEKSVIPLLQEYFYEDYQKIQLVLGDNGKSDDTHKFILDSDVKVKEIFKGNADDVIDLPEKKYEINAEAFSYIESYKEIL